jgi:FkbM family methyltransferase
MRGGEMIHSGSPDVHTALKLLQDLADNQDTCSPRRVDKPLLLYGAGNLGVMAREFFDRLGIPFLYVVDSNPGKYAGSKAWNDVSILSPDDVSKEHRAGCLLAICIATCPYLSIADHLQTQGWQDVVPFYDIAEAYKDRHPLSNGWFSGALDGDDREGLKYALMHWSDDISRAHHLQFIAWHKQRTEWTFHDAPVTTDDRFFIPPVLSSFREGEVFVDGGAHHGEVSLRFMEIVHHKFAKVYAIEPDKHNIDVLRSNLSSDTGSPEGNIQIHECALGKRTMRSLFYHGLGYTSQFSSLARDWAPVKALDEMDIPASVIKFHLEGWEYDALLGSMNTLKTHRPTLAVTIYHNRDGLWKIPGLLMNNLQDYIYLLRLHSWVGTGCVVYAIPREKFIQ